MELSGRRVTPAFGRQGALLGSCPGRPCVARSEVGAGWRARTRAPLVKENPRAGFERAAAGKRTEGRGIPSAFAGFVWRIIVIITPAFFWTETVGNHQIVCPVACAASVGKVTVLDQRFREG